MTADDVFDPSVTLEQMHERLTVELAAAKKAAIEAAEACDAADIVDAGQAAVERDTAMATVNRITDKLADVEQARRRIGAGTYGHCTVCSQPIAPARLEAIPTAETCVNHKKPAA